MAVGEESKESKESKTSRKKRPKQLAVINQNGCTGCEVCIEFCPVDCILVVPGPDPDNPQFMKLVEVDLDRCIGCTLCAQFCPWETIPMLPYDEAYEVYLTSDYTLRSVVYADEYAATTKASE